MAGAAGDLIALLLLGSALAAQPGAPPRVAVTVNDLFASGHRLEIVAGTEVVWSDPHVERVWFAARSGAPRVERTKQGFRAVFAVTGTYRGVLNVAGAHGADTVYDISVVVTSPPR